jgi:hypothetical protein
MVDDRERNDSSALEGPAEVSQEASQPAQPGLRWRLHPATPKDWVLTFRIYEGGGGGGDEGSEYLDLEGVHDAVAYLEVSNSDTSRGGAT